MLLIDDNDARGTPEIVKLLQQSCPINVVPLNQAHLSDFFFGNYEGKRFQFSRKQAGEIIGNIDEAEDQLRDYYQNAEYNCQIVEGIISSVPIKNVEVHEHETKHQASVRELGASIYCYKVHPNGVLDGHSFSGINISMYFAWVHRIAMAGITTYQTINYVETARLLSAIYHNEQKPPEQHDTLQRVIRPRLTIREASPMVKALMYLSLAYKLDIGEKKATAIAEQFPNIMSIAISSEYDLCQCKDIGKATARKLMSAIRGEEE
jgi:hypothetical protein